MTGTYLIGRAALRFGQEAKEDKRADLSAIAFDGNGKLWTASDETTDLEQLRPSDGGVFDYEKGFPLKLTGNWPDSSEEEVDIEGLDIQDDVLWLTGSHTSTRRNPMNKKDRLDPTRMTKVARRPNRYVLARLPLSGGKPKGAAAHLPFKKRGNSLTKALRGDAHLGPFLKLGGKKLQLASKENGFDLEGLAVRGERVFLGLRGPVLRGWAALLEIQPETDGNGALRLQPIGSDKQLYRKHFLALDGMGVRDLAWHGDRLLVLAGPTMDITGRQSLWALNGKVLDGKDDTITPADGSRLEVLFDLPEVVGADKAEGLALYHDLGEPGVLIAYDSPAEARLPDERTVYADVFRLPGA